MAAPALELHHYPYGAYLLEDVLKPICSEHGGIAQSLLVSPIKYSEELVIKSVVAQMPAYHKVLLSPHLEMQYHLSGYGTYYEEALIRLAGEAIERYSLMVAQYTLRDQIRYASYAELAREGRVVPFEYLRPFAEADYERLNRGQYQGLRRLEQHDTVGWVRCPSLVQPDTEIWVPAQMLFVGYRFSRAHDEVAFCPGFSTGTAAHSSPHKALQNALLEFIEIDALMLRWYTERAGPAIIADDLTVASMCPKLFAPDSGYEVLPIDLRVLPGVDAHVIGTALIHKRDERPFIVLGAQGHLDPQRAFYRSLMEAVAIAFLGIYGPLYLPKQYFAPLHGASFTDLDQNVALFASPDDAPRKRAAIRKLVDGTRVLSALPSHDTGNPAEDTARLVRQLASVSEFGVFLDVTPPETRGKGWHVSRVFLPELLTMCVPGVPYSEHPRLKAHGGARNEFPHPLP